MFELLQPLFNDDLVGLSRFGLLRLSLFGEDVIVSRTGYTGEDGIELIIPNRIASKVYQSLIHHSIQPCGLGARDSLRLEAGLPLYGQDISLSINPLQTRYPWVISSNVEYVGKHAIESFDIDSETLVMTGVELSKGIARSGYSIVGGGQITSGTLSPFLQRSIAIAYLPQSRVKIGNEIQVLVPSPFSSIR